MKKFFTLLAFVAFASMSFAQVTVIFNVDMTPNVDFNPATYEVYIAGGDAAIGAWTEPGTNPAYKMTRVGETSVYTITANGVAAGDVPYKFFSALAGSVTWSAGEWEGDPNRVQTVAAVGLNVACVWADQTFSQTVVTELSGVSNINSVNLSVYPNPSNGLFTVKAENDFNLNVVDVAGKLVYQGQISNNVNTVDLTNVQAGMYFFKFSSANNSYFQRVIVK